MKTPNGSRVVVALLFFGIAVVILSFALRPSAKRGAVRENADTSPENAPPVVASHALPKAEKGGNFDKQKPGSADREKELKAARETRTKAAERLTALVPGVKVDFDEKLGTPKFVASNQRFLTGVSGSGGAVSAARAAEFANIPHAAVKAFVAEFADLFGHGPEALDAAEVKRDYTTEHNGLRTTVWQQHLDGIRVFESTLQAHVTRNGELVNVASTLLPDVDKAAGVVRQAVLAKPPVDVRKAIRVAAAVVGDVVPEEKIVESDVAIGQSKKQKFRAPAVLELSAEYVWLPMDAATLRLCWEVVHVSKKSGEMFKTLVDAQSGVAVVQHGLTNYISPASYRVFTSDSPTPMSPGHATPLTTQPAEVARTLATLDALNTTASPNGWINDGVTETLGNNVDAHLDLNADNVADTPRPQSTGAGRVFDPAFDSTQAPSASRDASVVNLFYWNNVIHDRFYELGFTEAAGNFQTNNFGRGGNGNDAVQADSQDGSGTNNANFSTPADGSAGRMQMFVFTGPTPDRDSSFDAEIVIHEYTHGLSNRLVGGGVGISVLQTQGMGEGWSDFYALGLLSEASDNVNGQYAKGGYSTREIAVNFPNYYFGIRRYPYSTDMTKSPLTFKDIDPTQASPHTGVPLSPRYTASNANPSQVHGQGEVWCNMLREVWVNLVNARGHATGNTLALRLVTDGMKLSPANPNFVQARDAILQAELVYSAGANRNHLWAGFAKRGLGASATSPASSTTTGVVENYDLPDDMSVSPAAGFTARGNAGGPFDVTSGVFTVRNNGTASLNWTVAANQPWLSVSSASGTLVAGATATVTVSLTAAANSLADGLFSGTVVFTNATSTLTQTRTFILRVGVVDYFTEIFSGDSDVANQSFLFTPNGTPGFYRASREARTTFQTDPTGGTGLAGGDDTYFTVALTGGATVSLYGTSYGTVYVGTNGYVTFGAGDSSQSGDAGSHFLLPRVSAIMTDLYPTSTQMTWKQTADRAAFTWQSVPVYGTSNSNSFQIELFFDGRIRITILGINATSHAIGLSRGLGTPTDFAESDFSAYPPPNFLTLTLPARVAENTVGSGTITATPAPTAALTVNLVSAQPSVVSLPPTVTIPAGATSTTFNVSPVNNSGLNGSRTVSVSATASGNTGASGTTIVDDDETDTLVVSVPATATEGDAPLTGTVSISGVAETAVSVALSSSNTAEVTVPATVLIPAGQSSATFAVTVVNDNRIDGAVNTTITASVLGWTSGSGIIEVADNELSAMTVALPTMREGDVGKTGTVTLSGTLPTALTVSLSTSDASALTVPATVTIAAGATSVTFALGIVDDTASDGPQTVTVTAATAGFPDASATGAVADNDAHHFTVGAVASPQIPNANFAFSVTARDVSDAVITNYNSAVALNAVGDGGAVVITPTTLTGWANGVWTGNVKALASGTNVVLTVSDAGGHTGATNAFDVMVGPLHHFGWSVIASPQYRDTPFAATLTAQDVANNTVMAFGGAAGLLAEILPAASAASVALMTTGNFTNGVWSGSVYIPYAGTSLRLVANDGAGHTGTSATFAVSAAAAPSGNASVFTEDFESGVFGAWWTITGTNTHRTQITTLNTPHGGTRHMTMDSSVDSSYARNEATLTVNLAGRTDVVLRYWAVEWSDEYNGPPTSPFTTGADFDGVAISANGTTWYEVQPLSALSGVYAQLTVDLDSAIAARGLSYNSTFKIRFNHYDDFGITTDGFGFDDIAITATAIAATTTVSIPAQVAEGSGAQTGTVTLAAASGSDRVVALASGAPAKITVPASVTVLAGQISATFTFTVENDAFLDGNKSVFITALAPGDNLASATTLVVDDDVTTIALSLSVGTVTEGAAAITGTATLGVAPATPLTLTLSASPAGQVTVPATVAFGIGQTTATFSVGIVDDTAIDGSQAVTLSLGAAGWTPGTTTLTVLDNENTNLALTAPALLREGQAVQTGTVTISGTLASALVVDLTSSDTTELTVPATVTIPAGQTSANFSITIIDDTDLDGAQNVTITAAASGFTDATATRSVGDNDAHHFSFATIGSPQVTNGPIPVTITARDFTDGVVTTYAGTLTLTAAGSGGALAVSPATLTGFVNGVKTAFVQINAVGTAVVITATDALGRTGASNPVDIAVGNVTSFAWDPVPPTQTVDTPFPVRIRALDSGGNTAAGFNGAASLGVMAPVAGATIGTGLSSNYTTFYSYYQDARTNSLYTAAELGGAGRLTGIAYNFTSIAGTDILSNLTIRLKHTSATTLTTAGWDNTGWTQVYRASPAISASGWMTFNFSTPFDYNGTSNLLVDISFDRAASSFTYNYVQSTDTPAYGTVYSYSDGVNGDPLTWTTAPTQNGYYSRADIRISRLVELPIRPGISGNFVNGVWDGQVSVPFASSGLALRASAGTLAGTSNSVTVVSPPPAPGSGATVLSEDFESGTLNPAYWTITGTGGYHTINTSLNGPHGGLRHMTMDEATDSGVYARNEATLAVNLAGRTGVQLKFWAIGYSEDADGPPPSPFPSTGGNFDGVAISADGGTNWYEVQPLRSLSSVYTEYTVDLDAAMSSRGLSYGSNFKIRFNQYDNFRIAVDGIGIDDILITAVPLPGGLLAIPTQATEGTAGLTGTITLPSPKDSDTLVTLASSAPAKLSVPATVLIQLGQTTATFPLTLPDDALLDGSHSVYVTATAPGSLPVSATMTVLDNETGTLTLSTPATVAEGATAQTGTISISPAFSGVVTVALASSDTTELTVPTSVTIPLGQTSVTFPITIINDTEIDGAQSATITAIATGLSSATATTQVTDNETRTFSLSGPSGAYEGLTSSGTVYITGTLPVPLVVTLTSSNPTQFSVPATVTIPAGSTSATFVGTAVEDTAMDGTATAVITASAATFTSATYTTSAYDNDVHHFSFSTIAAAQVRGRPFSITVTARDVNNSQITVFTGTTNLSAASGATPLTMTPTVTGAFSSGSWTGNVTISSAATSAAITATGTGGISGASNLFNVGAGSLAGLVWGVVPSPQTPAVPFSSTLSAQDAYGNTVTTFNSAATIAAGPMQRAIGAGTTNTSSIFTTGSGSEGRSQMIYLASEVGAAGRLTGLTFNLASVPSTATRFTIRVKHTTLSSYTSYAWETTGWTTVFQSNVTPTAAGLLQLNFTTPFDFNGTSNLMFDCSFDGTTFGTASAGAISFSAASRQMYYYTYAGTDPLTWLSTNTYYTSSYLPNLKLRMERTIPVSPTSVTLINGVWSGNLTLGATGTNLTLTADTAAGITGESNVFSSVAVAALAVTPVGPVTTTGYRGGPFTPLTHTFTVTNGGSGAMDWTASGVTPWLSLSSSGGTLASGASTGVTATLDAAQLAAMPSGNASAVVSFANTTNGIGNTTRTIQLTVNAHGQLVITSGSGGNYTLTNSGDASLNWTATAEPWLVATQASGTLAIGATTSVNVAPGPLAALLLPGHYDGALAFANASSGHGNASFTVPHDVFSSPAPVVSPEPPFTGGTENTIAWTAVASVAEFEAQSASDAAFTAPQTSGAIATLTHTLTGLAEGIRYYRVRARELLRATSAWMQATPAVLASGTKSGVVADATGVVLINSPGGPIAGRIQQPSFESGTASSSNETGTIDGWTRVQSTYRMAVVLGPNTTPPRPPMPTQGAKCLHLFSYNYAFDNIPHTVGSFGSATQQLDFTGSTTLDFDAMLTSYATWTGVAKLEVRIDGTPIWAQTVAGTYSNQSINVSGYAGIHTLEFRQEIITAGNHESQWAYVDNLRLNGIGSYSPTGTLVSTPIPRSLAGWGQLLFNADTPANTALTVDVLDSSNAVLATGVANGADLAAVPAIAAQTSIRLRANLSSTNTAATPRLRHWLVTSFGALATVPTAGSWSNVVTSTQDATGPVTARTSALAVGSATYTPSGTTLDLAGVQSVMVNGIAATTTNAFATWIAPAITLAEGANTLTVTANDAAVPPNTSTAIWTITLATDTDGDSLPDAWETANGLNPADDSTADTDGDGLNNLLEYALGLDPNKSDSPTSSTTIEVNPADGQRYLVYHVRRRVGLAGWTFDILSSPTLGAWSPATTEVAAPPTPHADGVGETIHLRVLPSVSSEGFIRLRVTAP